MKIYFWDAKKKGIAIEKRYKNEAKPDEKRVIIKRSNYNHLTFLF